MLLILSSLGLIAGMFLLGTNRKLTKTSFKMDLPKDYSRNSNVARLLLILLASLLLINALLLFNSIGSKSDDNRLSILIFLVSIVSTVTASQLRRKGEK